MKKLTLFIGLALMTVFISSCTIYEKIIFSSKDIIISNPCEGETGLDFKFISLIGDKDEQTLRLTGKFINHDVNKNISVGGNLVSYDEEGNAHNNTREVNTYKALTDVTVKFSFSIPGQMVPKRNKKMPVISFEIGDCHIEMRNVPIVWKTIDKENNNN